jgi:hypothetical protein
VGRTDRLGIDARQPYRRGAQGDRRQRPGTAPDPNDRPHRIPVRRRGREGRPSVGSSSAIAGAANANQASAHALVLPAELGITPPLWRLIEGPAQGAHPGRSSGARPGASRARWRSMTSARQPQAQDRQDLDPWDFPVGPVCPKRPVTANALTGGRTCPAGPGLHPQPLSHRALRGRRAGHVASVGANPEPVIGNPGGDYPSSSEGQIPAISRSYKRRSL